MELRLHVAAAVIGKDVKTIKRNVPVKRKGHRTTVVTIGDLSHWLSKEPSPPTPPPPTSTPTRPPIRLYIPK